MKTFRTSWIFFVIVVLLAAYTYREYKQSLTEIGLAEHEHKAFLFGPNDAVEVRLTRGAEVTLLTKESGKWQMQQPVQDLAESSAVDGFLWGLSGVRLAAFQDGGSKKDWAEFGLEPPLLSIEVKTKNGSESISIGSKNAFDGAFFVRQKDDLFLSDPGMAQIRDRTPASFRSRSIWRLGEVPIDRVEIKNSVKGESFRIEKAEGGGWKIRPEPEFAVSSEKIAAWIERVRDFAPSEPIRDIASEADRKEFGLDTSSFVAKFFYAADPKTDEWVLTVGRDLPEFTYLTSTSRPTIYKTTPLALDPIRISTEYFRDSKKPFSFPLEQAGSVEVNTAQLKQTFRKGDKDWAIAGGDPKVGQLDQEKLIKLIQEISNLDAKEFVKGAGKGIKTPQIQVRDAKGNLLLSLAWGEDFPAKELRNRGMSLRFVKTNAERDVMGVAKEKLDKLVDPSMIKK